MFRVLVFTIVTISTVRSGKRTDIKINPVCTSQKFDCTSSIYWDFRKSLLYYIGDNKLVTCDPKTEEVHSVEMDNTPIFIQPSEDPDCVLIGIDNTVQSVQWDGMSDTVGKVQTIATIDEGDNTVIVDASTSFNGNLTLIVQGSDANGGKTCSIYGMKTDGVPGRINIGGRPYADYLFNHMQWNCTYAYLTATESRVSIEDNKFYNNYGFDYHKVNPWNPNYSPEGSAIAEDNNAWQLMNYDNDDNTEVFKLIAPSFYIAEYFVLPIKRATSMVYGNEKMDVLYVTTRKNESDTDANAGGLYKVEEIGANGLPQYIAVPEGTEVDYCSNPLLSTTTTTTTTTTSATTISTTTLTPTTASKESTTTKKGDGDDFCNCYFKWLQYYNFQYNVNVQASYRQAQVTNGASQTDQIETNGASQTDQIETNGASQTDQIKANGASQTDQIKANGASQTDQIKADMNKVPDISEYLPTFCLNYVKYFSDYIQNYQQYVQQYSQANQPNYQDYSKYGQGIVSGSLGDPNDYYKNAMKIFNCMQQRYNYNWNTQNNWG